jgi:hypothetical protein
MAHIERELLAGHSTRRERAPYITGFKRMAHIERELLAGHSTQQRERSPYITGFKRILYNLIVPSAFRHDLWWHRSEE